MRRCRLHDVSAGAAGAAHLVVTPELSGFAAAWDRLVDRAPLPSPFLRSWWLESVAEAEPRFLLVVRGDDLRGGLALQIDTVGGVERVRLLGDGPLCSDHLDLVCDPSDRPTVERLLTGWLDRPGDRIIDLSGLVASTRLGILLPGRVRHSVLGSVPWIDLRVGSSDYLASRPAQLRKSLRHDRRRLESLGCQVRHHRDAAQGLAVLEALHRERFGSTSGLLPRFDRFAAATELGAGRGEVVFHELWCDERPVACEVGFEVAGRASFYQSGRAMSPRFSGAGTVLRGAVIDDARVRGLLEYDMLRGDERYKRDWATATRAEIRLQTESGMRGRAMVRAERLADLAGRARGRLARAVGGARA